MTDNDIINNIIWCMNPNNACADCPYYEQRKSLDCVSSLFADTIDLINRQKAEIDKLNKLCEEQNEEIKRQNEKTINNIFLMEDIALIEAKAVKDFLIRLTMHFASYRGKDTITIKDMFQIIQKIAEETVGDAVDK